MIEKLSGLNKFLITTKLLTFIQKFNIKIMKTMRVTFVIFEILKISILFFKFILKPIDKYILGHHYI